MFRLFTKFFLALTVIQLFGCASGPNLYTDLNSKDYTDFLWGKENRYLIFQINGKQLSPVTATEAKFSGSKEGLYCLTTEFLPCAGFPRSSLLPFTKSSHQGLLNKFGNAFKNGGSFSIGIDDIAGEKVFDKDAARSAVLALSEKIYNLYKKSQHDSKKLLIVIKEFSINTDNIEILKALAEGYNSTVSANDKAQIESYLVHKGLVQFKNPTLKTSDLHDMASSGLFTSIGASGKDYNQSITVMLDKNAGIPLQFNRYKVKVKVTYYLKYNPPINGEDKDYAVEEGTVILSPQNNYSEKLTVKFKGIPSFGYYKPMGMGLIAGLGQMLGMSSEDANSMRKGIPFELIKIKPEYEVISLEAL